MPSFPSRTMRVMTRGAGLFLTSVFVAQISFAQNQAQQQPAPNAPAPQTSGANWSQHVRQNDAVAKVPGRNDMLRGAYGPFRANNDLLYYHLDVRLDPVQKTISGKTTVRFRMLQDGSRIQLDLQDPLHVDKIVMGTTALTYEKDASAIFINFP